MKRILLILMTLANVAMANDAEIKAMIVGTWRSECDCDGSSNPDVYKADGTLVYNTDATGQAGKRADGTDAVEKWWVKDGMLVETDYDSGRTDYFKILLLTERVLLLQGMTVHSKGYFLYWRKDEDL
jgi:hypothetical protein